MTARDMEARPYSADELRVVEYIRSVTNNNVGAGDDPIGFLLVAHALAVRETMKPGGWLPIESAKKTSSARLVWCPELRNTYEVTWDMHPESRGWKIFGGGMLRETPTHWRPLPPPPETPHD